MASNVKSHVRKRGAERRQEILEATMELVSKAGVEGVTVARIAEAVGITPGALYRHFDSRGSLLSEAHQLANQRSADWVGSSNEPDVLKRLEEVGSTHAAWAQAHFATVVRPFFMELASTPGPDAPDRLPRFTAFRSFNDIEVMVEEGKAAGTVAPDVIPEDVAWAVHMFAWTEDIAIMAGEDRAFLEGTLLRNLHRLLESFRAKPDATESPGG
jgi:AcrR family transcriptional regulator